MSGPRLSLVEAVEALTAFAPAHPAPREPLALILWENIGYLIDDERRAKLFEAFVAEVGLEPAAIAAAPQSLLLSLAERGGMRPDVRVERWRAIARLVLERCDGDLAGTLRGLPVPKAKALLKAFPTIGDPGADRILLFCGLDNRPAVDTNGLRALVRLGFFAEQRSWAASYKAGLDLLAREGRPDAPWRILAYERLRDHGKALCRRGTPLCAACPLDPACAHAEATQF